MEQNKAIRENRKRWPIVDSFIKIQLNILLDLLIVS